MTYRVELSRRTEQDLRRIYGDIRARHSLDAAKWIGGLEAMIASLDTLLERGSTTLENPRLRELLYGSLPRLYRVIYAVDERRQTVRVVHIRHGARDRFTRDAGT